MSDKAVLKFYKLHPDVTGPSFGTSQSACFDLHAHFTNKTVMVFDANNDLVVETPVPGVTSDGRRGIKIHPGARALIPTGLIFGTPEGYSVRLYSRSSVGVKRGLKIVQGVGVFDSDFYDEALIPLHNITNATLIVGHGERIAQAELVELAKYDLMETDIEPTQTTNRVGGFGSTGV